MEDPERTAGRGPLEEARRSAGVFAILVGDWGGQIYLTVSACDVRCDQSALEQLLANLDRISWESNGGQGAELRFEQRASGSRIDGGMGGGQVFDGRLWIHEQLDDLGLAPGVLGVLGGERARLPAMPSANRVRTGGSYHATEPGWPVLRFEPDGSVALGGVVVGSWDHHDSGDRLPVRLMIGLTEIAAVVTVGKLYLLLDTGAAPKFASGETPVEFAFTADQPVTPPAAL